MTFGPELVLVLTFLVLVIIVVVVIVVLMNQNRNTSGPPQSTINFPVPQCRFDTDCPATQLCQGGSCRVRPGGICVSTADCVTGLLCLPNQFDGSTLICRQDNVRTVIISGTGTVTTPVIRPPLPDPPESDDEINSCGSYDDYPFELKSGESTERELVEPELYPPVKLAEGRVIDLTHHSTAIFYLLENGTVIEDNRGKIRKYRLEPAERIFSFQGYLYVLIQGEVYRLNLPEGTTTSSVQFPRGIIDLSVSNSGSLLWLQTRQEGYLFSPEKQIERIPYSACQQRVYDQNQATYLEIDRQTWQGYRYPGKQLIPHQVGPGSLLYRGRVYPVPSSGGRVVLLHWQPHLL